VLLYAVCLTCLPCWCLAQQNKLVVNPPDPITVKRGAAATQVLKVTVLPGFHVNSDKPKAEYVIPLRLTWSDGPVEVKSVVFPKPEEIKVGPDLLTVFTGSFEIRTDLKAADNAAAGSATLNGKLRYQACSNDMCFRPASIDIHVPVVIE